MVNLYQNNKKQIVLPNSAWLMNIYWIKEIIKKTQNR